jgi:hypothetical protein
VESVVDSLVEVSISASDGDVKVSMEVTGVVGISVGSKDSIELEMLSKMVGKIVDFSVSMIELVVNVDELCGAVDISGKIDVLISLSSVEESSSSSTSEVVVMKLLALVDVEVIPCMVDISFDDIGNEDFVSVIMVRLIDVVNKSLS